MRHLLSMKCQQRLFIRGIRQCELGFRKISPTVKEKKYFLEARIEMVRAVKMFLSKFICYLTVLRKREAVMCMRRSQYVQNSP